MSYTYEQGKATEAALIAEVDKWDAELQKFPKGAMGLTPDDVERSPDFQNAKRNFDSAFAAQRLFSAGFTRRYKKEMLAERKAKREGEKMFTNKQLNDFAAYVEIQRFGQINMYDVLNGCRLSGLTRDEYVFVMSNYSALREQSRQAERVECRPRSPYERTRAAVYATGNKWAIENFHATHD